MSVPSLGPEGRQIYKGYEVLSPQKKNVGNGQSFRPVLSTSRCKGSAPSSAPQAASSAPAPAPRGFGRGTSSVSARRHKVEWSGTARSSPSKPMTEPISPRSGGTPAGTRP